MIDTTVLFDYITAMRLALRLDAARLWRSHPRETLALGLLGIAGSVALAGSAWSTPTLERTPVAEASSAALPAASPLNIRPLPADDALAANGAIPFAKGPNPAARPFSLGHADAAARSRALECLTSAIYYEAANESADGQRAVAQVVLNRVRHPAFPETVCGVVYEGSTRPTGCQFTFTCDGSLVRRPSAEGWSRARAVASAALAGSVHAPVGHATHYHANYVVPYWAATLSKNAAVGTHIFYRWAGNWGRPRAFIQDYAQREPDSRALRLAALRMANARAAANAAPDAIDAAGELAAVASSEGGQRVAVRFNAKAREAVEAAPRIPYVEKVAASNNLRWTLSGGADVEQEPLGRAAAAKTTAPAADAGADSSSASLQ